MELFKLFGTIAIDNSKANNSLDEVSGKGNETQSKLGSAFKKIGGAVAAGFAVDKIKDFGLGCIQAAADANATASQFSQVFGELEKKASKSLSGIAEKAGISENRMKGSFTKIASFAKTTGMETDDALALSERAMIAVADSAAFYDRSLEDTTESLQSFLKGNFENDAALGLSCTETTRNAAANKLYGKSFKDLSESQKQLTLLKMVEDANKASGAIGQAARESDTWTNMTGNLQQAWTDFKAVIGDQVLDGAVGIVKKMVGVVELLTDKVPVVVEKFHSFKQKAFEIGEYAKTALEPILTDVKKAFETVKDAVAPLIEKLKEYFTSGEAAKGLTDRIKSALDRLGDAYQVAKSFVQAFIDGLPDYVTNGEAVKDITNGIKDAVQFLADKFQIVKDALQPYLDKISEYISSGEAAEDITEAVKTACEILKDVYDKAAEAVQAVVQGFKDAVDWGKQHETGLMLIATAVGTLTTAITLYNIANAIKNAGGIAEIVQLGILQVQLWALTAAETAHTIATTIATAATSAFGAVLAFVTSPITLVILAIGALIAIGILLYKNWDVIKEKCAQLWQKVKDGFEKMKQAVTQKVEALKTAAVEKFEAIKSGIQQKVQAVKDKVSQAWENVKSKTVSAFTAAKNKVVSIFSNIYNSVHDKVSNVYNTVKDKFDAIKNKISDIMETVKTKVRNAIEKVKGMFDFDWSLPDLKMPHFKVSGGKAPWGFGGQGSLPSVKVEWYKKAYDNAMILEDPTIFGYNQKTGKFLGGGDGNGNEIVAGESRLMTLISNAVAAQNESIAYYLQQIIDVLATFFPQVIECLDMDVVLNDGVLVGRIAPKMDKELGRLADRKGRGR